MGPGSLDRLWIRKSPARKRILPHTLYISAGGNFWAECDPSKWNRSIGAIPRIATNPGFFIVWRGPVIVHRMTGEGGDQDSCEDIDMNDFRHAVDNLLSYNYHPKGARLDRCPPAKGVRINCLGDQTMFQKPQFEAVEIPLDHPVFFEGDTPVIAERVRLPVFTLPWPSNSDKEKSSGDLTNENAKYLHLSCDADAESWGTVPHWWVDPCGSVIVVRQDMKPVFTIQIEALCKYCRKEIHPLMVDSREQYGSNRSMDKQAIAAMICRPQFHVFWTSFLKEKEKAQERRNSHLNSNISSR